MGYASWFSIVSLRGELVVVGDGNGLESLYMVALRGSVGWKRGSKASLGAVTVRLPDNAGPSGHGWALYCSISVDLASL